MIYYVMIAVCICGLFAMPMIVANMAVKRRLRDKEVKALSYAASGFFYLFLGICAFAIFKILY